MLRRRKKERPPKVSAASEISRVPDVAEVVKESGEKDDFTRVETRG